jgi:hypothetical protein
LLKRLFSLHCIFWCDFVKNKVGIAVWIHIRVLYSISLVFISVFVPVLCYFNQSVPKNEFKLIISLPLFVLH